VSLILALAAQASLYTRLPVVGTFVNAHRVGVALAAYVILMLGVLLRCDWPYAAFAFGFTSAV
jgi:hypothetical protein